MIEYFYQKIIVTIRIIVIIAIIVFLIFIKLLSSYLINASVMREYNNENYNTNKVKSLYFLNINQPYIPYYNEGTILYKMGEYDNAIEKYNDALKHHPDKEHVCDIRINLSLAMIAKIDDKNKEQALKELKEARKVLYEDDCADPEDESGESEEAEELEEEIKQMEEEVENNNSSNDNNDDNKENEKPSQPQSKEEQIEQQIREQQKSSSQIRNSDMEYINNGYDYNYGQEGRW